MFVPKHILVPTDFSNYASYALKQAVDIAKQYHAEIHLLHVIDEKIRQCLVDYCLSDAVMEQITKESVKTATEILQQEALRMTDANPDVEISYKVRQGVPYEEIMNEQEEKKIDLIVIASHGKTGSLKHPVGSVAEKVLNGAKSQVLLVKS
jgi:nucleotide-binding universal stress UspA family protein